MRQSTIDNMERVLALMHQGKSLRKSCKEMGVSTVTFLKWVELDPENERRYVHARDAMIDFIADEMLDIADQFVGTNDNGGTDHGAVQKQRLQVDTRKWLLSKLAPKKYGDKVTNEITGGEGKGITIEFVAPKEADAD